MKIVTLPKENFAEFVGHLSSFGEIHAPTKRGDKSFVFVPVKDVSEIDLDCIRTILPLKKYFFRPMEVMFNFCSEEGYEIPSEVTDKRIVIFGAHPCDIHGLNILDMVFKGKYVDTYYFARRSKAAIIGLDCVPDDLCFCRSTGTDFVDAGFDLFLSDIDDSYLVRVGTSLGDDMVRAADSLFREVKTEDREKYKRKSIQRRESFQTKIELQDLPGSWIWNTKATSGRT